ncbi:hypothetical protein PG990_001660 [Apiospora arundinis]
MRAESQKTFWLGTSREERDAFRDEGQEDNLQSDPVLEPLVAQIEQEDKGSHKLLYFLFQKSSAAKVEDAVRKWAALPPLPLPETSRHMVDEMIRLEKPHQDLEKATTLKEVEERVQCVVHYGTWAMKGHVNPDHIFKTIDTRLARSLPRRILYDIPSQVLPMFTEEAVGLASEAVRFLFSTMAPDEYTKCLDVYKALPENNRVPLSKPTFSTLFVLGINSYTQRHSDNTDVKFGFASLVGLLPPKPKDPWIVGGNQNAEEKTTSEADKEEEGDLDL